MKREMNEKNTKRNERTNLANENSPHDTENEPCVLLVLFRLITNEKNEV